MVKLRKGEEPAVVRQKGEPAGGALNMRRSVALARGAKGYNWYRRFVELGADGFKKNVPPTAFDWSAGGKIRPCAFFELKVETEALGRVEIELAEDIVPATVENFRRLCEGKGEKFSGYKGTLLHQVLKGQFIMGGDVSNQRGAGSHSSFKDRFIKDENFIIPHSSTGLVSMASVGVNTGGSQFYITMGPCQHLNGRCVVFGRVVKGMQALEAVEKIFSFRGMPARAVTISDCGVFMPKEPVISEVFTIPKPSTEKKQTGPKASTDTQKKSPTAAVVAASS